MKKNQQEELQDQNPFEDEEKDPGAPTNRQLWSVFLIAAALLALLLVQRGL